MRLLCRNKIYDVAVSHQLTAERTGYQCRGRGGGGGGDFIAPAPHFTFCILAEIFTHTSKLPCFLCRVQLVQKISFSDSSSFSTCCPPLLFIWPVSSFSVLFCLFFSPIVSSCYLKYSWFYFALSLRSILLALMTCTTYSYFQRR